MERGKDMLQKRTEKKIKIIEAADFSYSGVNAEHRELQEGSVPPHGRALEIRGLFKETYYYYCLIILGLHE